MDLNADLGEGVGDDEALLALVTSANVATGAHAGGGAVLARTVRAAVAHGVRVGAHPSYRDRQGFGRRSQLERLRDDAAAGQALVADLVEQVLLVHAAALRHGAGLSHVKAHGALYNDAVADEVAARLVADAALRVCERLGRAISVTTQPGGALAELASRVGLPVLAEGFVDRGYLPGGVLQPRDRPGAVLDDVPAMVAQALDLAAGEVATVTGARIGLRVDTLCVHGDTPDAVLAARAVRSALLEAGWQVAAPVRWP
ncbi:MAG TPA: LamB/YcsF family protein [Candidatus Nanopelagicales bacterium]